MKPLSLLKKLLEKFALSQKAVHYLCGTEVLPHPLDAETESLLLSKVAQGDNEAKDTLVEHNLRLVVFLAKKFESSGLDMEDLVSVGTIGLIKAINSFKPEKQIKLATYASRCIENEILMYLRKLSKRKQEVSLDEPLNVDGEGNELLLADILGTETDAVYTHMETQVERQLLNEGLSRLTKREQQIIEMRFGLDGNEERTQKEVADMLGISQSYISRLEKKIISRLKKEIGKLV
ncbi:MAG: RNA polymerase sporulation sigma factor SigE [Corallococcus sp.]|nr:RNA polymerase sporulation sigma factor SigE [Corallococcus sp.]MCM1360020.1 RNA polymerase sporulation sigma factor SigE [Corallococcus sp.]MCM1395577.1 RNA polymerase sporulation sigma factor SigE [Corallococcus sp.]